MPSRVFVLSSREILFFAVGAASVYATGRPDELVPDVCSSQTFDCTLVNTCRGKTSRRGRGRHHNSVQSTNPDESPTLPFRWCRHSEFRTICSASFEPRCCHHNREFGGLRGDIHLGRLL